MKTIVYIDGFNFFYGRLSKTSYKWLDLCKFSDEVCTLLGEPYTNHSDPLIRFYTSPIKRAFSTSPETAPRNQQDYIVALKHACGDRLLFYQGRFNSSRFDAYAHDLRESGSAI